MENDILTWLALYIGVGVIAAATTLGLILEPRDNAKLLAANAMFQAHPWFFGAALFLVWVTMWPYLVLSEWMRGMWK